MTDQHATSLKSFALRIRSLYARMQQVVVRLAGAQVAGIAVVLIS